MTWLPAPVVELVETALVTELSVVRADERVITYPLIPMWDGEKIVMTSSMRGGDAFGQDHVVTGNGRTPHPTPAAGLNRA